MNAAATPTAPVLAALQQSNGPTFAQWLSGLHWDGKPRLMNWLHKTLHPAVRPTSCRYHHYLRLVGKSVVMGHVARAAQPGCKYDHGMLLLGPAGSGKSSLVRTLVGPQFYCDEPIDITSTRGKFGLLDGAAAYELIGIQGSRPQATAATKAFLSRQTDRYRAAYGAGAEEHPRAFLVWVTTNAEALDADAPESRRLWPVYVQRAHLAWLQRHREQVFAEAVQLYRNAAPITPSAFQHQAYIQPEAARWMRPAQP